MPRTLLLTDLFRRDLRDYLVVPSRVVLTGGGAGTARAGGGTRGAAGGSRAYAGRVGAVAAGARRHGRGLIGAGGALKVQ